MTQHPTSLRKAAIEGALWAGGQAVASKTASFISQLVLARLLLPEQFGLVAMATSISAVLSILQGGGIRAVLIRRQHSIQLWSLSAFWMSVALGSIAMIVFAGAAPFIATFYSEPRLGGIIPILAVGLLVDSLAVVPIARLQAALRFQVLGRVNLMTPMLQAVLSVGLASMGAGAVSLVLPKIPVGLLAFWLLMRKSGLNIGARFQVRRWKYIFSDSGYQLLASIGFVSASQLPVIVLAKTADARAVGLFSFAATLTSQVISLFTAQLDSVLFPTLAKLDSDRGRQWSAFLAATEALGMVVITLNGLQLVAADALVAVLFGSRWSASVPSVEILCVGNAFLAAAIPTGSALQARGLFKAYCLFAWSSFLIAFICAVVSSKLGATPVAIAAGTASYQILVSVVGWGLAVAALNGTVRALAKALLGPLIATAVAVLTTRFCSGILPRGSSTQRLFSDSFIFVTCDLIMLLLFVRRRLENTFRQITGILSKRPLHL